MQLTNKLINWLSDGELDSLRYKLEIYEKKIQELMSLNDSIFENREKMLHKRILDQTNTINKQSSEIGRLRHFEQMVMRQRAQKRAWKLKQKEGNKNA